MNALVLDQARVTRRFAVAAGELQQFNETNLRSL
jgi:hypothetical protein